MSWLMLALCLVLLAWAWLDSPTPWRAVRTSFQARYTRLFSPTQATFLRALDRAAGEHYRIFAKVAVADALEPHNSRLTLNSLSGLSFDFVLCRPEDFAIVGIVELDEAQPAGPDPWRPDTSIRDLCTDIGLPILVVRARHDYPVPELRVAVHNAFGARV